MLTARNNKTKKIASCSLWISNCCDSGFVLLYCYSHYQTLVFSKRIVILSTDLRLFLFCSIVHRQMTQAFKSRSSSRVVSRKKQKLRHFTTCEFWLPFARFESTNLRNALCLKMPLISLEWLYLNSKSKSYAYYFVVKLTLNAKWFFST